jgi:flagellar protein FliS
MGTADKYDIEQRETTMFTSVGSRSVNAYKRISVETVVSEATPHHLIEMLFDGLLNNIGAARLALARGDTKVKCEHIGKSVRILEEGLKDSLNLARGGELAANLLGLYDYCVLNLTLANLRNDDALMGDVSQVIAQIADGWKQIGSNGALTNQRM